MNFQQRQPTTTNHSSDDDDGDVDDDGSIDVDVENRQIARTGTFRANTKTYIHHDTIAHRERKKGITTLYINRHTKTQKYTGAHGETWGTLIHIHTLIAVESHETSDSDVRTKTKLRDQIENSVRK